MNLYDIFEQLDIEYDEIEHEKVFTIEEANLLKSRIDGIGCKNLFLTDKKDKYILVLLVDNKKADIKQIERVIDVQKLTFAKEEELKRVLKLERGSVTPFGIINDYDNKVTLVIDRDLIDKKILFHPNVNTKTISIAYTDLIKFIEFEKHSYVFI